MTTATPDLRHSLLCPSKAPSAFICLGFMTGLLLLGGCTTNPVAGTQCHTVAGQGDEYFTTALAAKLDDDMEVWSKTVQGIRGRIFSIKPIYDQGETLVFVAIFQNVSQKPVPFPSIRMHQNVGASRGNDLRAGPYANALLTIEKPAIRFPDSQLQHARAKELTEPIRPGELRISVFQVTQKESPARMEMLKREGAPDLSYGHVTNTLEPGTYAIRAHVSPAGFPPPDGSLLVERSKEFDVWKGKMLRLPLVYFDIASSVK